MLGRRPWRAALLAAVAGALAYANTLGHELVYDDIPQVVENPWLASPSSLPQVFLRGVWDFDRAASNYYRPLMHVSYLLTFAFSGRSAWGYHLVNVLLHALVCALVLLLAHQLLGARGEPGPRGGALEGALATALLFAVHPVHSEVVAWVACVPELLMTLLCLVSWLAYRRARGRSQVLLVAAVLAYLGALLAKETAIVLVVLLLLDDRLAPAGQGRDGRRPRLRGLAGFVLATLVYGALRVYAVPQLAPIHRHPDLGPSELALTSLSLFAGYLGKTLVPLWLSAYHVLEPVRTPFGGAGLVALVAVAAWGAAAWLAWKRSRLAFLGLALFTLPLLPVLYIPALGENSFAERYLYLPSLGLALLAGQGYRRLLAGGAGRAVAARIALVALSLLLACGTFLRNRVWHDNLSLWTATLARAPGSAHARAELGSALLDRGRLAEAAGQYEQALALEPGSALVRNNYGILLGRLGRFDEAIQQLRLSLVLKEDGKVRLNLGSLLEARGEAEQAFEEYRKAVELRPDLPDAQMLVGVAWGERGDLERAIRHLEEAAALSPDDPVVRRNLANAYRLKGWTERAAVELDRARSLEGR